MAGRGRKRKNPYSGEAASPSKIPRSDDASPGGSRQQTLSSSSSVNHVAIRRARMVTRRIRRRLRREWMRRSMVEEAESGRDDFEEDHTNDGSEMEVESVTEEQIFGLSDDEDDELEEIRPGFNVLTNEPEQTFSLGQLNILTPNGYVLTEFVVTTTPTRFAEFQNVVNRVYNHFGWPRYFIRGQFQEVIDGHHQYDENVPNRNTRCVVCQCDFQNDEAIKTLPCNHEFHKVCVDRWLQWYFSGNKREQVLRLLLERQVCPLCRSSVD